jgi:hypothetical protein
MKKHLNLEEILDYIAIEEAPRELIYRWKAEVQLKKERKKIYTLLLRPSVVLPLVLAGFWYYFVVFRKELLEYYLSDKLYSFLREASSVVTSSVYSFASSNYYIIGASIFSIFLATISLFWFYQGKKLKYLVIKNW